MRPGLRFKVLARDNYTCRYCGAKAPDVRLHVDHVVPRSAGGKNDLSNLVTACQTCNQGKYTLMTEQASAEISAEEYWQLVDELEAEAIRTFRFGAHELANDWMEYTGTFCSFRQQVFLNELLLGFGYHGVYRAMKHLALLHGFGEGTSCEHVLDELPHDDDCPQHVSLDLFELRQTLRNWRRDGFA